MKIDMIKCKVVWRLNVKESSFVRIPETNSDGVHNKINVGIEPLPAANSCWHWFSKEEKKDWELGLRAPERNTVRHQTPVRSDSQDVLKWILVLFLSHSLARSWKIRLSLSFLKSFSLYLFFKIYLFVYFWLHWVFVATCGLSPVTEAHWLWAHRL